MEIDPARPTPKSATFSGGKERGALRGSSVALPFEPTLRPDVPDLAFRCGGLPALGSLAWLLWGGEGQVSEPPDLEEPGARGSPLLSQLRSRFFAGSR